MTHPGISSPGRLRTAAATSARYAREWQETSENIRDMRAHGFTWAQIVAELETTASALYRRFYRRGENEWARQLWLAVGPFGSGGDSCDGPVNP